MIEVIRMLTNAPRGLEDILPEDARLWQMVEQTFARLCCLYGYGEIRTPTFEHTELYARGVGETTDVVQKEMYTFTDRGGRSVTLRPEGTAGVVRAFVEHKLYAEPQPTKLSYMGPMFRYGRPQAGRLRQFHQLGVEVFGSDDAAIDAEVIALAMDLYGGIGLTNLELHVNSIGCPACRPLHRDVLKEFMAERLPELCEDCRGRFDRNPMRILDCKNPKCQALTEGAPVTRHHLCPECDSHFSRVLSLLDKMGVPYVVDERLVRGLDYYTRTAFEVEIPNIGVGSLGGGGRYNGLVQEVGGPSTPGIGFGLGIERIIYAMKAQQVSPPQAAGLDLFIAAMGEAAADQAVELLGRLRRQEVACDKDYLGRSLKAQMKYADKVKARYVAILGDDELAKQIVVLRDMQTKEQTEVPMGSLASELKARLQMGQGGNQGC